MYTSPGYIATELGDIDVISHDGRIHLFHLVLPNHDQVAHATSSDGLAWSPAPAAIRTGDPGEPDDDMIWTMHTVQRPDGTGFHMYYTACSIAERGNHQRVALARSDDLVHWTKHAGNPILVPAPPHYNAAISMVGFVSFRDPFVFIDDDGQWHMLVTARTADGPRFRRGCIAHAVSGDGVEWSLAPPLLAPGQFEDMEVPSLLHRAGRYHLFFHDFRGHNVYRVAESLAGPWRAPRRDLLLPERNFVFRFCQWQGRTLLYHTIRGECDWKRRGAAGGVFALAPPKKVAMSEAGELVLRPFAGWSAYHDGPPISLGGFAASEHVQGQKLMMRDATLADFVLETTVQLGAGRAIGLFFRGDRGIETGNWIRIDHAARAVSLEKQVVFDSALDRYKLRRTVVQSAAAPIEHGRTMRLLACREYIEVALDDVVYLSAVTWAAQRGILAMFVEDGVGRFGDLTIHRLRPPWDS